MPLPMPGQFVWAQANVEVLENAGSINLVIERVNGNEMAVSVTYATLAGSAGSGDDFIQETGSIMFADGQNSASVNITLLDDPDIEGNEAFLVQLSSATGGASVGNPSQVQVLIRDDEDFLFADGFE